MLFIGDNGTTGTTYESPGSETPDLTLVHELTGLVDFLGDMLPSLRSSLEVWWGGSGVGAIIGEEEVGTGIWM